jgi:hypothetical protein
MNNLILPKMKHLAISSATGLSFVLTFLLAFVACESPNSHSFIVQITDDTLRSTVAKYIEQTALDVKTHTVSIDYRSDGNHVAYLISAGRSRQAYQLFPPDYVSFVEDAIIFIHLSDGTAFRLEDRTHELDEIMADRGILLEEEMKMYDPPLWILRKSEDAYQLKTKIDFSDLNLFCGD